MPPPKDERYAFTREDRELLIRLDERLKDIKISIESLQTSQKADILEVRAEIKENYVTKAEFSPVQKAVYAAIGFIVTGFLGGLITILIKIQSIIPGGVTPH